MLASQKSLNRKLHEDGHLQSARWTTRLQNMQSVHAVHQHALSLNLNLKLKLLKFKVKLNLKMVKPGLA